MAKRKKKAEKLVQTPLKNANYRGGFLVLTGHKTITPLYVKACSISAIKHLPEGEGGGSGLFLVGGECFYVTETPSMIFALLKKKG